VCFRCWNPQINMCNSCAPDLKSDAVAFQHGLNVEAQRQQIQDNYQAPQFNTGAVASAVTPDMVMPAPGQMRQPPPQAPRPASIAGFSTPGYPQQVNCPSCSTPGVPGKFCQNCGAKLPLPDLFCPKCSTQVAATSHFCPECGDRMTQ
jgi:membrane protease subunit (stomatin/prohibitin family)